MRPLDELRLIMEIADKEGRLERYQNWVSKNIVEVEESILVLNASQLSTEDHDMVCEELVNNCTDRLIENKVAKFDISNNKYLVRIVGIRDDMETRNEGVNRFRMGQRQKR